MLILLSLPALAGSGPWTVSSGDLSAYLGSSYEHFSKLATSTGKYGEGVIDVDEGVGKTSGQLILDYGLRDRIDVQLSLPYTHAEATREDGALCGAIGLDGCKKTDGVGVVSVSGKALLLDELAGSPISLSVAPDLRFGQLSASKRARVTNLGEGTTDLGLTLAIGRAGAIGPAIFSGYVSGGARYRFPNVDGKPGAEGYADAELLVGGAAWSIGPSFTMLSRPEGYDVEDIDFADVDRFSRLSILNVRGGGKLIVRSDERVSFVLAGFGTIYAVNNPSDTVYVTAGVSVQTPLKAKEDP